MNLARLGQLIADIVSLQRIAKALSILAASGGEIEQGVLVKYSKELSAIVSRIKKFLGIS